MSKRSALTHHLLAVSHRTLCQSEWDMPFGQCAAKEAFVWVAPCHGAKLCKVHISGPHCTVVGKCMAVSAVKLHYEA